jgi:hypothetical protein
MPEITLRTAQFHFGTDAVALLLEHDFGSLFANTTEAALRARMASPGDNWGNDEALAEAQSWVDADPRLGGKGYVVVLPPAPFPIPVDEPAATELPVANPAPTERPPDEFP